jgi:hypothetical protein
LDLVEGKRAFLPRPSADGGLVRSLRHRDLWRYEFRRAVRRPRGHACRAITARRSRLARHARSSHRRRRGADDGGLALLRPVDDQDRAGCAAGPVRHGAGLGARTVGRKRRRAVVARGWRFCRARGVIEIHGGVADPGGARLHVGAELARPLAAQSLSVRSRCCCSRRS